MIHVDEDQLEQIEYLLDQSKQGNHVIFDVEQVKKIFAVHSRDEEISTEEAYAVEPQIEHLMSEPTLDRKRAYLESLDTDTFEKVVRTYFNIVENTIYEDPGDLH